MRKTTKVLTFILILILLITNIAFASISILDISNSKYKNAIEDIVNKKIMNTTKNYFYPKQHVTKEELAQTIDNLIKYIDKENKRSILSENVNLSLCATTLPKTVFIESGGNTGAGVFVSRTQILTAYHVVSNNLNKGNNINFQIYGRETTASAKIVKFSEQYDLALLETYKQDVKIIEIAEKETVGQQVFAFGTPYNLRFSVSKGIISAKNRQFYGLVGTFTQIDVPINAGSSGGALVDINGKLVGIISKAYSDSDGLAFSVPTEAIRKFLNK